MSAKKRPRRAWRAIARAARDLDDRVGLDVGVALIVVGLVIVYWVLVARCVGVSGVATRICWP